MQTTLQIRVVPNAGRNACAGRMDDGITWKIRLAAPALDGKANTALVEWLSDVLDISGSAVTLLRGKTSRSKVIALAGISAEVATARLEAVAKQ